MYPSIVTQRVVDDMQRQAHQGGLVDWSAFRQSETSVAASMRDADSGAQGSRGALSGGSGGGGAPTVGGGGSW